MFNKTASFFSLLICHFVSGEYCGLVLCVLDVMLCDVSTGFEMTQRQAPGAAQT